MATGTILQKVKVKEEAKECCGFQQSSVPTAATSTSSGSPSIATATGSSSNGSNVVHDSNGVANVAGATTSTSSVSNASGSTTSVALHQPSAIVCHPSAAASSAHVNADPFPVDLDLKTKAKGAFTFFSFSLSYCLAFEPQLRVTGKSSLNLPRKRSRGESIDRETATRCSYRYLEKDEGTGGVLPCNVSGIRAKTFGLAVDASNISLGYSIGVPVYPDRRCALVRIVGSDREPVI